MTPAQAGQITVVLIIIGTLLYKLGVFRGFRAGWRARDAKGGAVRMDVVRGSKAPAYRAPKKPVVYPAIHPEAEDFPGAG